MSGNGFEAVRGIYFDLDDTLCGYWDASKTGLRRAFEREGPEGCTSEECVRAWATAFREFAPTLKSTGWYEGYLDKGEPTRTEQMRRTLAQLSRPDEERAIRLSEAYMIERDRALKLFDDALLVLGRLSRRYPLGLITNGPADIQRMEIATLGIGHFFQHIFIEGELRFGKPKPEVFQQAAAAMGLPPESLLIVGNSFRHDILPAMAAGWRAAWIRRESDVPPSAGDEQLRPEEPPKDGPVPHATITELSELLELLPTIE